MTMSKKPNILFVFSDQHRFCDMSCAGNADVQTPNMDALAREGAYYMAAYSNCPLCVPARGSLLTGLHALKHGAAANDLPVKTDTESVADVLNRAGYDTAYIGKWHLHGMPREAYIPQEDRLGFKYWRVSNCNHNYLNGYYDDNENVRHPLEGYAPIGETGLAIDYIENRKNNSSPFALFLSFGTPHDPYDALPEGDLEKSMALGFKYRENWQDTLAPEEIAIGGYHPDSMYAGYYAHIRRLDEQLGRLIKKLKDDGLYDNTIIVYTSDHGDMLGSHGFLNKQIYFDESARIPFIISWPGHIEPGKRSEPISTIDMAPSLLGITGLSFRSEPDGCDISPNMLDKTRHIQDYVYFYSYVPCHQAGNRSIPSWRAVSNGKQTLVKDQDGAVVALFDMVKDPYQMINVKDHEDYAPVLQTLEKILDAKVALYDDYIPWEELLKKSGLFGEWERSEAMCADMFRRFQALVAAQKK